MITDSVESKMHKLSKIIVLVMKLRKLENGEVLPLEGEGVTLKENDVKEFVDFFLEEFNDITADIYAELGYSR